MSTIMAQRARLECISEVLQSAIAVGLQQNWSRGNCKDAVDRSSLVRWRGILLFTHAMSVAISVILLSGRTAALQAETYAL